MTLPNFTSSPYFEHRFRNGREFSSGTTILSLSVPPAL